MQSRAAEPADPCAVPGYLLFGDSQLDRVNAEVKKDKTLKIVALGGTSSTLPGPDGATFAYPARLEAALTRRLPGVKVTVTALTKPRQTAEEMAESIENYCSTTNRVWWYGKREHMTRCVGRTQKSSGLRFLKASRNYKKVARTSSL